MKEIKDFEIIGNIENDNDDNVDVFFSLLSDERFVCSFFTLKNIETIMRDHSKTGECVNGLYLWSSDMIIVNKLTEENIIKAIEDMLEEGYIYKSCSPVNDLAKAYVEERRKDDESGQGYHIFDKPIQV